MSYPDNPSSNLPDLCRFFQIFVSLIKLDTNFWFAEHFEIRILVFYFDLMSSSLQCETLFSQVKGYYSNKKMRKEFLRPNNYAEERRRKNCLWPFLMLECLVNSDIVIGVQYHATLSVGNSLQNDDSFYFDVR